VGLAPMDYFWKLVEPAMRMIVKGSNLARTGIPVMVNP
jgi:hypothetical protein